MERTLTKDTKIRLTQIQRETQDARRTYKVGEISEKTGLQKQPNGTWAPPKNAAPAASEKKVVHTPGGEPYKPGSLYKTDPAKLAEQARKEGNAKKAEFYEAEAKKEAGSSEAKPAHEPPKVHSNGKTWRRSNWSTFSNGAIVTNPGYAASMTTQELKKEQSRRQEFYNEEKAKGKLEPHDAEAIEKSLETINKELSKRTTPKLEKDGFEIKIPKAKTSAGGFGANTTAYIKRGDKYYKQEMMAGDWMGLERATQEEFENAEHDENSHFSTSSINTLVNTSKRRLGIQDSAPTLASIFESVKK